MEVPYELIDTRAPDQDNQSDLAYTAGYFTSRDYSDWNHCTRLPTISSLETASHSGSVASRASLKSITKRAKDSDIGAGTMDSFVALVENGIPLSRQASASLKCDEGTNEFRRRSSHLYEETGSNNVWLA
jgi:hypothetical protein